MSKEKKFLDCDFWHDEQWRPDYEAGRVNPASPLPISCSEALFYSICFDSSAVKICLLRMHQRRRGRVEEESVDCSGQDPGRLTRQPPDLKKEELMERSWMMKELCSVWYGKKAKASDSDGAQNHSKILIFIFQLLIIWSKQFSCF